jgi:hypothetical protein
MLDAYRDLIDELLGTPTDIRGWIASSGQNDISPEAAALIAEIRDRDRIVLERAQTMTRQRDPYLTDIRVAAALPDEDPAQILAEMEAARGDLVSLLINLSLKDWERAAIHETKGEVTLADEIEQHVEFDEAQRRRLRDLLAAQ